MSSEVTFLHLCPRYSVQSGLCCGRGAPMGLLQVWLSQQEDPDLPQTQCGVAGWHLTHPLAEQSHGGGWPR